MRRLLIAVTVVVALAAAGDTAARLWVQGRLAARLQTSLGLDVRPSVSLQGFPILPGLLRGRLQGAAVEARGPMADGLRVARLDLDLSGLRFPLKRLVGGDGGTVRVDSGTGTAEIADTDLTAYLAFHDFSGRVTLSDGEATVDLPFPAGGVARATGPLTIDGGALVFTPRTATAGGVTVDASFASFRFDLPAAFPGASYRSIEVLDRRARIALTIRDGRIEVPTGG